MLPIFEICSQLLTHLEQNKVWETHAHVRAKNKKSKNLGTVPLKPSIIPIRMLARRARIMVCGKRTKQRPFRPKSLVLFRHREQLDLSEKRRKTITWILQKVIRHCFINVKFDLVISLGDSKCLKKSNWMN